MNIYYISAYIPSDEVAVVSSIKILKGIGDRFIWLNIDSDGGIGTATTDLSKMGCASEADALIKLEGFGDDIGRVKRCELKDAIAYQDEIKDMLWAKINNNDTL